VSSAAEIWIYSHVMVAILLLVTGKSSIFINFMVILAILYSLIIKQPSYDLVHYLDFLANPTEREDFGIAFVEISKALNALTGEQAIVTYGILILLSIFGIVRYYAELSRLNSVTVRRYIEISTAVLMSIFFFMGSQNVLRQYTALIILGLGFVSLLGGRKMFGLLFIAVSMFIHNSMPLVALIIVGAWFTRSLNIIQTSFVHFIFGAIFILLLRIIMPNLEYLSSEFALGTERSGAALKSTLYLLITASTHFLLSRSVMYNEPRFKFILFLRWCVLAFALPAVIFGYQEFYSRLVFPLFFLDLTVLIGSFLRGSDKHQRASGALILMAYSVAPNVINVYAGSYA